MKDIAEHLQKDEGLSRILERFELRSPTPNPDVYQSLLKAIVEQQLSTKAAATIWQRFLALFDEFPHHETILRTDDETLRSAGLSYQKASYLKNIARHASEGHLERTQWEHLEDDELVSHLSQIKGVGRWTAEMVLMFSLNRPDVFPVADLIIRNAMISLYEVNSEKRQLYRDLEMIAANWRPYRSYACYLLWDWYEVEVLGRTPYSM